MKKEISLIIMFVLLNIFYISAQDVEWILGGNIANLKCKVIKDSVNDSLKVKFELKNISKSKVLLLTANKDKVSLYIIKANSPSKNINVGFGIIYSYYNSDLTELLEVVELKHDSLISFETRKIYVPDDNVTFSVGIDFAIKCTNYPKKEKNILYDEENGCIYIRKEFYLKNATILRTIIK